MHSSPHLDNRETVAAHTSSLRWRIRLALVLLSTLLPGCAAITNPVANGIPVRLLSPDLLAQPREQLVSLPLTYLRRAPPQAYRLSSGDILGIYIEGILGEREQAPPVSSSEVAEMPPAVGFPISVGEDGTVSLPLVNAVRVADMTLPQARRAIIDAYIQSEFLKPDRERVLVTLMKPRTNRILVIREDSPGSTSQVIAVPTSGGLQLPGNQGQLGQSQQGTGAVIELPAYESDVLNALTVTGGLPGTNAKDEIVIQRGYFDANAQAAAMQQQAALLHLNHGCPKVPFAPNGLRPGGPGGLTGLNGFGAPNGVGGPNGQFAGQFVRIPLRLRPGEPPPFSPEDIVLKSGDIVYVESRDAEVFYTGGLMRSGQFPLPRDYDLDAVEAVSFVSGPMINGGINSSNLSGSITSVGIGNPSPSQLTVLRRIKATGRQVNIKVDLNEALRDPRESLIIQPGDVLILQETPGEAFARYMSHQFNFTIISDWIRTSRTTGTASFSTP